MLQPQKDVFRTVLVTSDTFAGNAMMYTDYLLASNYSPALRRLPQVTLFQEESIAQENYFVT